MEEEKIRQAFGKAKQDVLSLYSEISSIKQEIQQIKYLLKQQSDKQTDTSTHFPADNQTQKPQISAIQHINTTQTPIPAHSPADNLPFKAPKSQISTISIGNEGVPTDKQTDQQTDNSTGNKGVKVRFNQDIFTNRNIQTNLDKIEKLSELLNSLDNIKKDLRQKFKKLTKQEMTIFSTIYQLEEEGFIVDYPLIAKKLSLTESSIRDYIQRLIKKGIPLIKTKENNKKILISISQELKKIASLSTIIQLREI